MTVPWTAPDPIGLVGGTPAADELRRTRAELVEARLRLEQLSRLVINAQEQERGRIARELHDEIGHALTALRMQLDALGVPPDPQAVEQCKLLADEAVVQVRRLALNLRPAMLDEVGLVPSLEWVLQDHARRSGWAAFFHAPNSEERYPAGVETACFRILQEALTNTARHAAAAHVDVSLTRTRTALELVVTDDGCGFELGEGTIGPAAWSHFGLVSMRERAKLLGGELRIISAPGRGTRVHATLPCRSKGTRGQASPALRLNGG